MKIILHLAISADGFIAKANGDSDWVTSQDEILFKNRAQGAGCLVVGRKTFDQYQGVIYPIEGIINIVLTSNPAAEQIVGVLFAKSPQEAIELANKNKCPGILIAGGAQTSTAFLNADLIDEIFLSVYPLILGEGIKPFEGKVDERKIKLLHSRKLKEGLVELCYSAK